MRNANDAVVEGFPGRGGAFSGPDPGSPGPPRPRRGRPDPGGPAPTPAGPAALLGPRPGRFEGRRDAAWAPGFKGLGGLLVGGSPASRSRIHVRSFCGGAAEGSAKGSGQGRRLLWSSRSAWHGVPVSLGSRNASARARVRLQACTGNFTLRASLCASVTTGRLLQVGGRERISPAALGALTSADPQPVC